jgi:hypothetical protein
MPWSALNHMMADDVRKLLDRPEFQQEREPEMVRFFSREKAEAIIHAALWGYGVRATSTAGAYAFSNLMDALGLKNWTFNDEEAAVLSIEKAAKTNQEPHKR